MNLFRKNSWSKFCSPWKIAIVFLLFLAVFTRLYQLGSVPAGMTWDEVALGYVGKMVVTTGRDEYNHLLPRTFESFGDYKAPLAFYVTGVSTTLFGMTSFATRLPFAIAGIISVILIMVLSGLVTRKKWYAAFGGYLLIVAPWHFLFSRIAFESGLSLMLYLGMICSWIWWHQPGKQKRLAQILMVLCAGVFAYSYHSAKIVLPLTLPLMLFVDWRRPDGFWKKNWKTWATSLIGMAILSIPLVYEVFRGNALERASQASFLGTMPLLPTFNLILHNFAVHLSAGFLVQGLTSTYRHGTGSLGVLLYTQAALFAVGLTFAIGRLLERGYHRHESLSQKLHHWFGFESQFIPQITPLWFWLILLPITLLPATIGNEIPHANRALLALVPIILLIVLGVRELQEELKETTFASIVGTVILIMFLEFGHFWQFYFTSYQSVAARDWLEGYSQAMTIAHQYTDQGKSVKFTSQYGQPEIFYAFATNAPFEQYRLRQFPNITFGGISANDFEQYQVVISGDQDVVPLPALKTISRHDDSTAFSIYEN